MRLLCDDAARLCWLVLREAAAAESEAACASLPALALSLLLVEIQRFRPTCSSSLSACNHAQSCAIMYVWIEWALFITVHAQSSIHRKLLIAVIYSPRPDTL